MFEGGRLGRGRDLSATPLVALSRRSGEDRATVAQAVGSPNIQPLFPHGLHLVLDRPWVTALPQQFVLLQIPTEISLANPQCARRCRDGRGWLPGRSACPAEFHSGSYTSRFSHSDASDATHASRSSSIAFPTSRLCGMRNTPGLCLPAFLNARKWAGIVPTSCETSTRWCSAASARTSGSVMRRNPAAWAVRKSRNGSWRRTPLTMALLRSASARNRTFTMGGSCAARRERA